MKEEIIISTKKLAIGYVSRRKKEVLIENINIEIPKGKLTAVIGLNGIGKSTLIKTLAQQQALLDGAIFLNTKNASEFTNNEWAKQVSWVQTNSETPLNLSVEEFISLGRQPYTNWLDRLSNKDKHIINTVIEEADLSELRKKNCSELSDGQLQRVTIARALAQDTEVIILDEPTTHLDIIHKIATLNLLKDLCKTRRKTIIYSTHEIEFSLQIADYILGISKQSVAIDTVQNTINDETLNSLFNNERLFFDKKTNRFKML